VFGGAEAEEAGAIPAVFGETPSRPTMVKPGPEPVRGDGPPIGAIWTAPSAGAGTDAPVELLGVAVCANADAVKTE
jgi:hypothetical protein